MFPISKQCTKRPKAVLLELFIVMILLINPADIGVSAKIETIEHYAARL